MEYSNWVRVRISREPYLPSTEDADVDNIKKKILYYTYSIGIKHISVVIV